MAFATIAAVVTVGSTVNSIVQGKKASKSQARANEAQMKINRLKNAQQKRLWLNQVRQQLAETTLSGLAAGVSESSRVRGALTSEQTQRDVGLEEFEQLDELGAEFVGQMNRAQRRSYQSQVWGQVASVAGQLGGYDKIGEWLNPKGESEDPKGGSEG